MSNTNTLEAIEENKSNKKFQQRRTLEFVEASAMMREEEFSRLSKISHVNNTSIISNISNISEVSLNFSNMSSLSNSNINNNRTHERNLDGDYWLNDDDDTISKRRKKFCCSYCNTRGLLIWIWVTATLLILGLIYAVAVIVTYQNCYHLTEKFDLMPSETISFDPNIYNNFIIEDFNNVQEGEIIVSQNNLRKSFPNSNTLSWLGYLTIPPKCISARLELSLPNTQNTPNTNSILKIDSKTFNIKLNQDLNSPIQLITSKGDIIFNNTLFTNQLSITTNNGNIDGNLNTRNGLNIITDTGEIINLGINIQEGIKSPNIDINSDSSNVSIKFNGTFNGQYDINSSNGNVKIEKGLDILNQKSDNIGNFNDLILIGKINIKSNRGNIDVKF
ncbi:338_t:CDS:2 [Rhizophagus irregularis]|nr:338_t:CDS:2 [Rhizophagus irregularis]